MGEDLNKMKNRFFHLLSGGLSGGLSRTFVAPIERSVILRQTSNPKFNGLSLPQILAKIFKEEGVLALFKGNGVNCLRISPFQAIEFYSYDKYKILMNYLFGIKLQKQQYFFCGVLSGMTASTLIYPLDLMRTIFSFQTDEKEFKGIRHTFLKILKEKGIRGLYKGWGMTMFGIGPYAGIKLSSYNILKNKFNPNNDQGNIVNLLLGSASGCFAVSITYPTDLLRKQKHIQIINGNNMSIFQVIVQIYKNQGIYGFYRGLGLTYLKVLPSTGLAFAFNEQFKKFFTVNVQY